jgi:hypothetical protein
VVLGFVVAALRRPPRASSEQITASRNRLASGSEVVSCYLLTVIGSLKLQGPGLPGPVGFAEFEAVPILEIFRSKPCRLFFKKM